ncbi:polyprenyl diphosphate synthase [Patescibacteria group bacterium]
METKHNSETKNIPKCIGIILDGNRRWAKEKGLATFEGHNEGYENLKRCVSWMKEAGVENLIAYAFSTENWKRKEDEVSILMKLLERMVIAEAEELKKEEVRVKFIGQRNKFSQKIQDGMEKLEEDTAHFTKYTLAICVSYGGRAEILEAVKKIVTEKNKDEIENLNEEDFSKYLWTKDVPDPDLIIRTGGEQRLSNFLPWQSTYSESFFTETKWPDFSQKELIEILNKYSERERRRGK